jgi:hypothetical protein
MKEIIKYTSQIFLAAFIIILFINGITFAATVLFVPQGGTGSATSTGFIVGRGTAPFTGTSTPFFASGFNTGATSTMNGFSLCTSGNGACGGAGTKVDSFNTRTGAVTLSSTDVTGALGFTPLIASNYYATTTHANISSLPALSITKSQVSDFGGPYLTGTKVDSFNTRTGAVSLSSSDVTGALGFAPLIASDYYATTTHANLVTLPSLSITKSQVYDLGNLTLDDLSGVVVPSPSSGQIISFNGANWINSDLGSLTISGLTNLFINTSTSDITGYRVASTTPSTASEATYTGATPALGGYTAIEEFATATGTPGTTLLNGGAWHLMTYASVDTDVGNSYVTAEVLKRSNTGVETRLFTATSTEITGASAAEYGIDSVQGDFTVVATDRLIVKYSAYSDNATGVTITLYLQGTAHYSHIHTPIGITHNNLFGLQGGAVNEYYHLTSLEYTATGTGIFIRQNSPTFTGNTILNNASSTNFTGNSLWSTMGSITNASTTYLTVSSKAFITDLASTTMNGSNLCTAANGNCAGSSGVSSITGTANQITANTPTGAVTLSFPSYVTIPEFNFTNATGTRFSTTEASTTRATLPTFWSTNGQITYASSTYATLTTLTASNGTIVSASSTNLTATNFWNTTETIGTSNITRANITNASTSALTINFSTAFSTSTMPFNVYTSTSSVFSISASGLVTTPTFTSTNGTITNASTTYLTVSDTAWLNLLNVTNTTGTSTITGGLTVGNNAALSVDRNATANSLFIAPNGSVGIGTTTPGSLLSVHSSGNVYFGGNLTVSGTTNSMGTTTMNGFNICTSSNGACVGASAGVSSITGTANQITASAATGAVTLSIPANLIVTNASTSALTINYSAAQSTSTTPFRVYTSTTTSFYVGNNGMIGIGTNSPLENLSIVSIGTGDNPSVGLRTDASGSAWNMGLDRTDNWKFKIASSTSLSTNTRFTIDGAGNVGIASSTPTALLSITSLMSQSTSTPALSIGTATSSLFYIGANGFVGLGTTSPKFPLSVDSARGGVYVGGTLTASGQTTLYNASSTALTATSFWSTTGNITSASTTNLTGTNFWGTKATVTNASTTVITASSNIWVNSNIVDGFVYPAFTYATSTAWAGTTTIPLGTAYIAETWTGAQCFTDVGTLMVSFTDGTTGMNFINASTTVGTNTLNVNNTWTVGEKRYVKVGNPATSPTSISCTIKKAYR